MIYASLLLTGILIGYIIGMAKGYRIKEDEIVNQDNKIQAMCNLYYQQGFKDAKGGSDVYGDAPLLRN